MNPPEGAIPLSISGYFFVVSPETAFGVQYDLLKINDDGADVRLPICTVSRAARPDIWNYKQWRTRGASHVTVLSTQLPIGPTTTKMFAEILYHAAIECARRNSEVEPLLESARMRAEERERERELERERWRKEAAERARIAAALREKDRAAAQELYDILKWMVDDKIRLTRDGRRSTIFGKILQVTEPIRREDEADYYRCSLQIITEREAFMSIPLREINLIEIKPADERRYTTLYKRNRNKERSEVA